jgi:nitrite reductase/ring-hydroxylating ferredoxin subunit
MNNATNPIPKWREDFPVESETDDFIARRDFVRYLLLVSGGLAVGSGWILAKSLLQSPDGHSYPVRRVCDVGDLDPGAWMVFEYPEARIAAILVRRRDGEFVSYLQKCTHLSCPVQYAGPEGDRAERLTCHCHNGVFDLNTGEGVSGPPRDLRPLTRVKLEVRGETVFAIGLDHPSRA